MTTRVAVTIVTYNSAPFLQTCLDSLHAQTCKDFDIFLWDNASVDETRSILSRNRNALRFTHLSVTNVGFCAGHNRLISASDSEYILVLNPDVILKPEFLENLLREMDCDKTAGSATGKLLRAGNSEKVIDSTGIYFTPNQRHFDRGSNEADRGQYEAPEYVFGVSGAAAFYRRTMLDDIAVGGQFFDEHFFAYREDADLAWRAQLLGWKCIYVPPAIGHHVRRVLPERRAALPEAINMHSFKNRFLMRIKNMDAATYARFFVPLTIRDLSILAYVLLFERSSLPGIPLIFRASPDAWAARKFIRKRRRISGRELRSWFSDNPVARARESCGPAVR